VKLSNRHFHYRPSLVLLKFKNMKMKRHCTDWFHIYIYIYIYIYVCVCVCVCVCDLWSLLTLTFMKEEDVVSKTLDFMLNIDVTDH
jgi:hypothetical protein